MKNYDLNVNIRNLLQTRIFFSKIIQMMINLVMAFCFVVLALAITALFVPIVFERIFVFQFAVLGICTVFPVIFFFIPDELEISKVFSLLISKSTSFIDAEISLLYPLKIKPEKILIIFLCCTISILLTFIETEARTMSQEIQNTRGKVSVGIDNINKILNEVNARTDISQNEMNTVKDFVKEFEDELIANNTVAAVSKTIAVGYKNIDNIEQSVFGNDFFKLADKLETTSLGKKVSIAMKKHDIKLLTEELKQMRINTVAGNAVLAKELMDSMISAQKNTTSNQKIAELLTKTTNGFKGSNKDWNSALYEFNTSILKIAEEDIFFNVNLLKPRMDILQKFKGCIFDLENSLK